MLPRLLRRFKMPSPGAYVQAARKSAVLALTLGLNFAPWSNVWADQGGVAFWLSGQYASLAALPATPGWSVAVIPYYYNGSARALSR